MVEVCDYEAAPFVNHCLFLVGSEVVKGVRLSAVVSNSPRLLIDPLLSDYHVRTGRTSLPSSTATPSSRPSAAPLTSILAQSAIATFELCQSALARQTKYWLGAGWIGALARRKGAHASRSSIQTATEGLQTFVSGAEMVSACPLLEMLGKRRADGFLIRRFCDGSHAGSAARSRRPSLTTAVRRPAQPLCFTIKKS